MCLYFVKWESGKCESGKGELQPQEHLRWILGHNPDGVWGSSNCFIKTVLTVYSMISPYRCLGGTCKWPCLQTTSLEQKYKWIRSVTFANVYLFF